MRNFIANIGLLIASIFIFLLGIEFVLRVTGLQTIKPNPPLIFQQSEHQDISYELKPNLRNEKAYKAHVSTNSLGFRGPELKPNKPTIAVFGDSVTFGYGVEDNQTLTAYMQELLPNLTMLNTAAPAYNLPQQTGILREKIVPLDPSLIILVFYFNDLGGETGIVDDQGILRSQGWDTAQRNCHPITTGILSYLPGKCWLDEHSAFYKAFKKVYDLRASKERKAKEQQRSQEHPEEDSATDEEILEYTRHLDAFVSFAPNTQKLFAIWPDQELHAVSRPTLKKIAEEHGFKVLDLYGTFSNKVPTLPWDTVHPSPEALKAAAKVIVSALEEHGLVAR